MAQQNSRAQQQRRQLIIILVVILLLALGLFYFVLGGDAVKSRQAAPPPEGKVAVPVLKQNFKMGQRISSKDFRTSYFDPEGVPIDAILKPGEIIGRFAARPLLAGNYIHEGDLTQPGANSGFSGIVAPGKRLVVIDGNLFPGALATLNVGDHIDLLAIGDPTGATGVSAGGGASRAARSPVSIEGGGSQPGDPNARSRRRGNRGGATVAAASATLVAENALVIKTPSRDRNRNFLVLEMEPQDAHVTTLMVSAGATMRYVFRPFNDEVRHTEPETIKVTTRLPKPAPDPDSVMFIYGNVRSNTVPVSQRFNNKAADYVDENNIDRNSSSALFRDAQGRANQTNSNNNVNNTNNNNAVNSQDDANNEQEAN